MKRVVVIVLAAVLLNGCSTKEAALPEGSALIETDELLVSAETSGRLTSLRVSEGSHVEVGDTIATIDDSRIRLEISSARSGRKVIQFRERAAEVQVAKAERQIAFAESEKGRIEALARTGSASSRALDVAENEFDQASQNLKAAETNLRTARAEVIKTDSDIDKLLRTLEDCTLIATLAGTVTEKLAQVGEVVSPGKGIIRIAQLDTVWAKLYLPSPLLAHVQLGALASVSTETSGSTPLTGTVIWTADRAEFTPKNVQTQSARADLVYAVKVQIPNPNGLLKVGMPVFVSIQPQKP